MRALDALESALAAENAAMDVNDIDALERALAAKRTAIAALGSLSPGTDPAIVDRIVQVKALCEDVEARVNVALAATARRIDALLVTSGTQSLTTYAADGKLTTSGKNGVLATA